MSNVDTDPGQSPEPIAVLNVSDDTPQQISTSDAARMLRAARKPRPETPAAAPAPAEAAEPPAIEPTPQGEDATPAQEQPSGEQTEAAEPASQEPPIAPPRSWTKAEKERFATLPRETQEYLAERETERDREVRRSQNESAEKLKGLTAKEQAAEQARQQYEAALPQLLQTLQSSQQGEFADIRTIADVENLARTDWPRYLQWDVSQKKLAAVQEQMQQAQQRQQQEQSQQFAEFAKSQDNLFVEKVPEMSDPVRSEKLQKAAVNVLKDLGFSDQELGASWNGSSNLSLRDHRMQLLIRDATLYREAQAKAKTVTAKPVPPVQRPGVASSRGASQDAELRSLAERLNETGNAKDAAAYLRARRAAAAR
jgi:hypothetical protein